MVSPSNTNPGLTEAGPGADPARRTSTTRPASATTPASSGTTSTRARRTRCTRRSRATRTTFVINDAQTYGLGIATLYIKCGGVARDQDRRQPVKWDKKATNYEAVGEPREVVRRRRSLPRRHRLQQRRQADQGPAATLGADFPIFGPDGWTPIKDATVKTAGPAANGMVISQPGVPLDQLTGGGQGVRGGLRGRVRQRARSVHGVRRAGGGRAARRDRARAEDRPRQDLRGAVQHEHHRRHPRRLHDRRQRRHEPRRPSPFFQVEDGEAVFVKTITPDITPEGKINTVGDRSGGGLRPSPRRLTMATWPRTRAVPAPSLGSASPSTSDRRARRAVRAAARRLARRQPRQDAGRRSTGSS